MEAENQIDNLYKMCLWEILENGTKLTTRNSEVYSNIMLPKILFKQTPLITVRKTAWRKAIKEMEWFISGDSKCPEELLDWWKGQLNEDNYLVDGYSQQFRHSTYVLSDEAEFEYFDQIEFILEGLRNNPNSRRLLISLWNPGEMAYITDSNGNKNTPTVCHSVLMQFFVREGKLFINSYQRSADMLLGVPHNWIQSWALLLYFAYHANLEVGGLVWIFGDAHIYNEESHIETANSILKVKPITELPELVYDPVDLQYDHKNVPIFKAEDFRFRDKIPEPKVFTRPKLL